MAWLFLFIAGLLEVGWSAGLKLVSSRPQPVLIAATAIAMCASLGALSWSMTRLPLGVAYPIWTGIGSIGSVAVSVWFFGQTPGWLGMVGIVLLVSGIMLVSFDIH